MIDETVSEQEEEGECDADNEFGCDSVRVSSKPSRLHFDESMKMQKQTSLTPMHQAQKSFEQQEQKLIVEIDNSEELNEQVSCSAKDEKPPSSASSERQSQAEEFVRTPKVQSLIQQMVLLKSGKKLEMQSSIRVTERQI